MMIPKYNMNKLILLVALVGLSHCTWSSEQLNAAIFPYPEQDTNMKLKGSARITQSPDGKITNIDLTLSGLQENCTCTGTGCDPGNVCGVQIHKGLYYTCGMAASDGGPYYSTLFNPWKGVNGAFYNNKGTTLSTRITLTKSFGYSLSESRGHALVVHNAKGEKIGCGLLKLEVPTDMTLKAMIKPYPGQDVNIFISGEVVLTQQQSKEDFYETNMVLSLSGLNSNCNCTGAACDNVRILTINTTHAGSEPHATNITGSVCGVDVHSGTTCTAVGGHYFSNSRNPWKGENGAFYNNKGENTFTTVTLKISYGYNLEQTKGHAVVVHNNQGEMIGCGILEGILSGGIWTSSVFLSFSLLAILFKFI